MPGIIDPRDGRVQISPMVLDMLKMRLQIYAPAVMDSMQLRSVPDIDAFVDHARYELRFELQAQKLGGERIERRHTVEYEFKAIDGPFQRWKGRHCESWWLRWYVRWRPVEYIREPFQREVVLVVDVEDYATFPESSYIPMPERFGPPVLKRLTVDRISER